MSYDLRSKYYEFEYDTQIDHALLASIVTANTRTMIEIPCGLGRNVELFVDYAQTLFAIDREPKMIARLTSRFQNLIRAGRVIAIVGDFSSFIVPEPVDLIAIPQGGLQLLSSFGEVRAALDRLSGFLEPGGRIYADIARYDDACTTDQSIRPTFYNPVLKPGEYALDWKKPVSGGHTLSRAHSQWRDEEAIYFHLKYEVFSGTDLLETFESHERRLLIKDQPLLDAIEMSGFDIVECLKNYDHVPFDGGGQRLIILAQKRRLHAQHMGKRDA